MVPTRCATLGKSLPSVGLSFLGEGSGKAKLKEGLSLGLHGDIIFLSALLGYHSIKL